MVSESRRNFNDKTDILEKEIMSNTVARVAYVGNHGSLLEQYYTYNDNRRTTSGS